jgi:hypothetical protein
LPPAQRDLECCRPPARSTGPVRRPAPVRSPRSGSIARKALSEGLEARRPPARRRPDDHAVAGTPDLRRHQSDPAAVGRQMRDKPPRRERRLALPGKSAARYQRLGPGRSGDERDEQPCGHRHKSEHPHESRTELAPAPMSRLGALAATKRRRHQRYPRAVPSTAAAVDGLPTGICVESAIRDPFFRDYHCICWRTAAAEPMSRDLSRTNHLDGPAGRADLRLRVTPATSFNAIQPAEALIARCRRRDAHADLEGKARVRVPVAPAPFHPQQTREFYVCGLKARVQRVPHKCPKRRRSIYIRRKNARAARV